MDDTTGRMDSGEDLERAVEVELGRPDLRTIRDRALLISERYRKGDPENASRGFDANDAAAYAATRQPATHAATRFAITAAAELQSGFTPRTLLDVGAGTGAAGWAAIDVHPSINQITFFERESEMAGLGRRLARHATGAVRNAQWLAADAVDGPLPAADLVVASFVVSELDNRRLAAAASRWWEATLGQLVIVEPGTPAGYRRVRRIADELTAAGAHVVAPCPHNSRCPLPDDDWCHFSVRLHRSGLHRAAKGASLPFEDEKVSFVALSREPPSHREDRVIRTPFVRKGHVRLLLCTAAGTEERVVSKREGPVYRSARQLQWGDTVPVGEHQRQGEDEEQT